MDDYDSMSGKLAALDRLKLLLASYKMHLIVALLAAAVGVGLMVVDGGKAPIDVTEMTSMRRAEGIVEGRMPLPTEPSIFGPLDRLLNPPPEYQLMTIKHIPPITMGGGMPHPFVGDCKNCHLFVGGPPPGSQFKTPYGALLERLSRVRKVGPPILPISQQPHPPAGRCIKCHDIVVKVPAEKKPGIRWGL